MSLDGIDAGMLSDLASRRGATIVDQPGGIVILWEGGACVVSGQVACLIDTATASVRDVLYLGDL